MLGSEKSCTVPRQTKAQVAARAAYRVGLLDVMLHSEVIEKFNTPGALVRNMKGERRWRLEELKEAGVDFKMLEDLTLNGK